jgi:hypothetical protein
MDFFEAMTEMRKGAKVKLKSWPDGMYIGLKEEEAKVFGRRKTKFTVITATDENISPCLPFSALVTSDWDLVD